MKLFVLTTALALAIVPAGAATSAALPAITDKAFQAEILNAHNRERAAVGEAPMAWSGDLAEDADDWARTIAKANVFKHASQRSQGENIWMAKAGRMTPASMVASWAAEKANYLPGRPHPKASRTGNSADVSHYTAIVWAPTTKVGCALARGPTHDFLVCRYSPAGNIAGYAAYDIAAAKRAQDAMKAAKKGKK